MIHKVLTIHKILKSAALQIYLSVSLWLNESLSSCLSITENFNKDGVPQVLPTTLIHLIRVY
ncbi:hypothetical protein Hdeb2414_s0007g00255631 [Helianthus debilis subsp. tardiflorus]